MKVQESFVIAQSPGKLWEFFEQVEQVARCVPGVEAVELLDADNSKVRVTQSLGPMTATFDLKMRITERRHEELMQFTAVGRAVRGAAGNVRTVSTVTLELVEEGTRVTLDAELAMGGVLGSVGQKVIAKQAARVTKDFSDSLERAIAGEPAPASGVAPAPGDPSSGARPTPEGGGSASAPGPDAFQQPSRVLDRVPDTAQPARTVLVLAALGLLALLMRRRSKRR